MNAIGDVLSGLHHGEHRLARELHTVSDRHRTEHEIHHVARDLERWSREHAQHLADIGEHHEQNLRSEPRRAGHLVDSLRAKAADVMARRPEPGLLLLRDVRTLYLMASDNSLHWEMLAQAAQARRDRDLLQLVSACHPQTLRQIRWANTLIKIMSPQIFTGLTTR
jgi:hypothetical protein